MEAVVTESDWEDEDEEVLTAALFAVNLIYYLSNHRQTFESQGSLSRSVETEGL